MRRKFKRIAAAAMATAMALSVAACGGSKKDSDKIILGYMGPLTGESALWGEVESNTLKMLVEETVYLTDTDFFRTLLDGIESHTE